MLVALTEMDFEVRVIPPIVLSGAKLIVVYIDREMEPVVAEQSVPDRPSLIGKRA